MIGFWENLFERLSKNTLPGKFVTSIGAFVRGYFSSVPYVLGYIGRIFQSAFAFINTEKAARKILIMQLLFTFIEALPIVVFLSAALGSAIFLVGYDLLLSLGQASMIYQILIVVVVRELGPVLVAFVVTARSSTAIATELGGMVTSHQVESYISVGVDPVDYLVAPRFLGVTLSVFFLCLYFSLCGILGPYIAAMFVNPTIAAGYFSELLKNCSVLMILTSILKSIVFGMIISITATYYGFNVERSSTEIPVAGIQAVSKSFVGIIIADVIIILIPMLM
ncbi:MAG: ABC transporter permease [Treponema sp.]|nr:ABC transporter permease [Treponema sp.]